MKAIALLLLVSVIAVCHANHDAKDHIEKDAKEGVLDCSVAHNKYRSKHKTPELKRKKELEDAALAHSKKQVKDNDLSPSGSKFGENLYFTDAPTVTCEDIVNNWYEQKKHFDFKNPDFIQEAGGFTQLIWKSTESVGCAFAKADPNAGGRQDVYVTCNYDPPGNVKTLFVDNVLPSH